MQISTNLKVMEAAAALFTVGDATAVAAAMPLLMHASEVLRMTHVAPNASTRRSVFDAILAFVRTRGRKVYGGFALNAVVSALSPGDTFYDMEDSVPDLEFYSATPVEDVRDICDALHAAGHVYVQGKEAMHHGTFTISVEFVRMCDVTFMPPRALEAVPVRTDCETGVEVVDPSFAIIDHLRIICDPFTSHWRLDRMFPRTFLLQHLFPIVTPTDKVPDRLPDATVEEETARIVRSVMAANNDSCAVLGQTALLVYKNIAGIHERQWPTAMHVTCVSTMYKENVEAMRTALGGGVDSCEYHPFLDLIGRRTVFVKDGREVATMIDAEYRAIPVIDDYHDGMRVACVSYAILTAMSFAFMARSHGQPERAAVFDAQASDIVRARRAGLDGVGKTVVDVDTLFRDFALPFIGTPVSAMKWHMKMTDERMERYGRSNHQAWFTYDPSKQGGGHAPRLFLDVDGGPCGGPEERATEARRRTHTRKKKTINT